MRTGIRKPNSAGLVTTTGTAAVPAADLVHTLGTNRSGVRRSAVIRKILAYNNTGGDLAIQIGTQDNSVIPLFVQLMPDILLLNGFDTTLNEWEIPAVEFAVDTGLLVAGAEGNIYVSSLGAAAGVLLVLEVEEFGI